MVHIWLSWLKFGHGLAIMKIDCHFWMNFLSFLCCDFFSFVRKDISTYYTRPELMFWVRWVWSSSGKLTWIPQWKFPCTCNGLKLIDSRGEAEKKKLHILLWLCCGWHAFLYAILSNVRWVENEQTPCFKWQEKKWHLDYILRFSLCFGTHTHIHLFDILRIAVFFSYSSYNCAYTCYFLDSSGSFASCALLSFCCCCYYYCSWIHFAGLRSTNMVKIAERFSALCLIHKKCALNAITSDQKDK